MTFQLTAKTDSGRRLVELAESLAGDFAGRAPAHDREASFPFASIDALKDAGYFAAPIPEDAPVTRTLAASSVGNALIQPSSPSPTARVSGSVRGFAWS